MGINANQYLHQLFDKENINLQNDILNKIIIHKIDKLSKKKFKQQGLYLKIDKKRDSELKGKSQARLNSQGNSIANSQIEDSSQEIPQQDESYIITPLGGCQPQHKPSCDQNMKGFPFSKKQNLNISLQEFLSEIVKYKQIFKNQVIVILSYYSQQFEQQNYYIKILCHQNSAIPNDFQLIIQFEDIEEVTKYHIRRNSYKIMKKIFESFNNEFGTSLNCIMTITQAGMLNQNIQKQIKYEFLEPILKSSKIILSLVNDMRDYNSLLGKTFFLNPQPFNLLELIDETLSLFREQISQKKINLEVVIDDQVPTEIISDPDRIKQIMINVLSNSTKFTNFGTIKIIVSKVSSESIKIAVEDTGIGMTTSQIKGLQYLFSSGLFYMKSKQDKLNQNTGISLFLSNILAKNLSGQREIGFEFSSQEGQGTVFV
eukprot:TRINITY_DN11988_c0_g2_i1.p1 TRINITY_DN11988_c0_g2~~TRINITY_DN11988_c0_g2_i1.p1  ORF type:complete len:429 (+),score=56.23 TRINITY_DN11988_c0_g2_i1:168-1454(+)